VADPVKNPAPSKPATSTGGAPAGASQPASKPAAPPPKPITSIDDLIERAEDRAIAKGSSVRVSPDNPDVASKARREELEDSLEACGIKVIWDNTIAKDGIIVEAGAKN